MDPCPNCGHTVSLQDLRAELEEAQRRKREREYAARQRLKAQRGGITIVGGNGIVVAADAMASDLLHCTTGAWQAIDDNSIVLEDPYVVCAKCGIARRPDAVEEAERLRIEIIETMGVIDALAKLDEE